MSTKIEDIELILKGPQFSKRVPLIIFCDVARCPDIYAHKSLWGKMESFAEQNLTGLTPSTYTSSYPQFFPPTPDPLIRTIHLAIDGRSKQVYSIPLLLKHNECCIATFSDLEQLRIISRRGTLFLQNFLKLKEEDYLIRQKTIMTWAALSWPDWKLLISGQREGKFEVNDFYKYLHYNNVFDKRIFDMDVALGDGRDGEDGGEVSMGLMGLLGGGGEGGAFGLGIGKGQEEAEKDFVKMMKEEASGVKKKEVGKIEIEIVGVEVEVPKESKPFNPFAGMSLVAQMAAKMGAKTRPVKSPRVVEAKIEIEVQQPPVEVETVEVEIEVGIGGFGGISGIQEEVIEVELCGDVEGWVEVEVVEV